MKTLTTPGRAQRLLIIAFICCAGSGSLLALDIEQAQRALQQRYLIVTGFNHAWPARSIDGQVPPAMPPDGFYALDTSNPNTAAPLVRDLASTTSTFGNGNLFLSSPNLDGTPYAQIQGNSSQIFVFFSDKSTAIDTSNYVAVFNETVSDINSLRYLMVRGSGVLTEVAIKTGVEGHGQDIGAASSMFQTNWNNTQWATQSQNYGGVARFTGGSYAADTMQYTVTAPEIFRWKVLYDLTRYTGSASCYSDADQEVGGDIQDAGDAIFATDGSYHFVDTAQTGQVWKSRLIGDQMPPVPTVVSPSRPSVGRGWTFPSLNSGPHPIVIVVTPTFQNAQPSLADPIVATHVLTCVHLSSAGGSGQPARGTPDPSTLPDATQAPVRYANGEIILSHEDITSAAFGGWAHRRSYSNATSFARNVHGPGWFVDSQPSLQQSGTAVLAVSGGGVALEFVLQGAVYVPLRFDPVSLQAETGGFVLTDSLGRKTHYYNFDQALPSIQQGAFKSYVDSSGVVTSTVYGADGSLTRTVRTQTVGTTTTTETFAFIYDPTLHQISHVERDVVVGAAPVSRVRQADYEYWTGAGADFGPNGTLKRVTIRDGQTTPQVLAQCTYRYYKQGDSAGSANDLKYVIDEKSYARIVAAGLDPVMATDAQIAPFADHYFEYDAAHHVSKEVAQATTCSCSTGQGTYLLAYQASTNAIGYNSWAMKTTETMPDGNLHIVYTNSAAEPMLFIAQEVATGKQWMRFCQYDSLGRKILEAEASAITGFDETKPDLLNNVSGHYQYLADSAGLIHRTSYGTTTTATATTAGNVAGYIQQESVSQGETGAVVPVHAMTYYTHADSGGAVIYPQATDTVYRNTDGTGGMTTSFSYTWQGSTNQILAKTTTAPVVTTAENGSNVATATTVVFDLFDRPIWARDQEGFITYHAYDTASGGESVTIRDVNTALTADFTGLPSGWATLAGGGLHLKTVRQFDLLARATKVTDPRGTNSYRVFQDAQHAVRTYPAWTGTATTGPTVVEREDWPNNYRETLTMSAAPTVVGGVPTGAEAISSLQSLSRDLLDQSGRPVSHDDYVSFAGISYGTASTLGVLNTNYYHSTVAFDKRGNPARRQDAAGTIRRVVNDLLDRPISTWIGTSDTVSGEWSPTNAGAMVQTGSTTYDLGGIGDGNATSTASLSGTATYTTNYKYDFRDRQTQVTGPDNVIVLTYLDNLGCPTNVQTYAATVAAAALRAEQQYFYDERGQTYWRRNYEVDPVTGALGNVWLTKFWYTPRGLLAKTRDPNGLFTKTGYDGAGRGLSSATCYQDSESLYADAMTLVGDTVIEQTNSFYDKDSNVVTRTRLLRKSTDTTGTGALTPSGAVPLSTVTWFDAANRPIASGDYGRDSGTTKYVYSSAGALIDANANGIPDEAEAAPRAVNSSNDYRITALAYDAGGHQYRTTDNLGRITQRTFDAAGQATAVIENYVDGVAAETETSTDRTTQTIYGPGWRVATLRALNPKGTGKGVEQQDTRYLYGSAISATWPTSIIYPDSSDTTSSGTDQVKVAYDRLGRASTRTDQRGVVHSYAYDAAGRLQGDAATTIPGLTGDFQLDTSILRIERGYDDVGRVKTVTSFNAASGGSIANQVAFTYNNLFQVARSDQSHSGAVVSGTTPGVSYAYTDGGSGGSASYARLSQVTYPTTTTSPAYLYPAAGTIGDRLSRLDSIASDSTGATKYLQYSAWLGAGTNITVDHPAVTGGLSFVQVGTATDMVDNFMEPTDWKWRNTSGSTVFDRYLYAYDRVGNRISRQNAVITARDEFATFDGLNRLAKFNRGMLSSGAIADTAATFNQAWTLDSLGNWAGFAVDANGGANSFVTQARLHNKANEIDVDNIDSNAPGIAISGTGANWVDPAYDAAGNMRSGPKPGAELTTRQHYRWDAWNRLTAILADNSGTPGSLIASYSYDGKGRRVKKVVGSTTLDSYYNEGWQEIEVRKSSSLVAYDQYIYDPRYIDSLVARFRDSDGNGTLDETVYFAHDAKFNVTSLISNSGSILEKYIYDIFGKVTIYDPSYSTIRPSSNYDNQIGYTGRTNDMESGLYSLRNRYFDPSLGRFVSRDSLGYVDGMSLYCGYFSPIRTDPFGYGWATELAKLIVKLGEDGARSEAKKRLKQLAKSMQSAQRLIDEHRKKLEALLRGEDAGMTDKIRTCTDSALRKRLIDSREGHLNTEIEAFEKNFADAENEARDIESSLTSAGLSIVAPALAAALENSQSTRTDIGLAIVKDVADLYLPVGPSDVQDAYQMGNQALHDASEYGSKSSQEFIDHLSQGQYGQVQGAADDPGQLPSNFFQGK